ncbi:hypothetical protein EUX98_g5627 [Antrodiella citrinella]|uniref:Membrane insertase YidC/Oxa/ALB C-terminal domain-containing protein n=1 Tax=Antrodiella citrinella TaxID=2447956 RepID=A0A4V6S1T9_9APHY|nr:hypothetical protein EUX98_g5627 [Antrodiella citrinella]
MEILQVSTGMPWFWTIVGAGLLSRVLLFPLSVITMKQSVALIPYQPEVNALRLDMVKAQRSGDPLQMQKAVLKQRVLYEKIGVSMPVMMTAPFMQLPVTLGMFFGIKSMCELPLEQLKWSGLEFLPDLTVTDPTYILPIVATIAMNVQLTAGMQDMSAAPQMPHIINFFRVLSLVGIYFMATLPSGVVVYITTSIIAMVAQTFLLRVSFVRRALGVPVLAKGTGNKPASMMESVEYAKKFFSEKMEDAKQDAIKARTKGRK